MKRVIHRSFSIACLLTAIATSAAAYQIEPFSMKIGDGAEVTVFTYRQSNNVSVALRISGPGDANVFISAVNTPDGTVVTITTSGGRTYKLQPVEGKSIALLDDQERPLSNAKLQADGKTFYDQIEGLRKAVAAKVASNSSVNADAVGGSQSLKEIASTAKSFSAN